MKTIKNNLPIVGFIAVLALLAIIFSSKTGLFRTNTVSNNSKLQVTTSFYPLYYFASQIGGYKAEIKNITPSGAEPHDYDPSTQDVARTFPNINSDIEAIKLGLAGNTGRVGEIRGNGLKLIQQWT